MRVLIYYQPNSNRDAFEGDRLRKTLKGECESMGIEWVDSRYSKPDIAHFVSDKDLGLMRRMKAKGVKTVVSAFYCERDLDARMLIADPKGQFFLRPKAKKMLNEADAVLVPSIPLKKFCEKNGIKSKIFVSHPSVNPDRFVLSDIESVLFLRYFGVSKERKFVLITGNFYETKKLRTLLSLAKKMPKMRFYFLGYAPRYAELLVRHYKNKAPKNLKISRVLSDDVYRSAMKHASAYLMLSKLPDAAGMMEAFSAKTPVIALGNQDLNPLLINGVSGRIAKKEDALLQFLEEIYEGEGKETTHASFAIAKKNSIERSGAFLQSVYNLLLSEKKEAKSHD